jgi:protein arginine N-methyltransferase 1
VVLRIVDELLFPETVLALDSEVRTRFAGEGHLLVETPGGAVVDAGPAGFTILSSFAPPASLGEVLERLGAAMDDSGDLVAAMGVVKLLVEAGALVHPTQDEGRVLGWADPVEHARMLHDRRRTSDYLAAIAAAVRPGDVVLDVGTGSGVLAVGAARAGARRVYALEATGIGHVAEQVFRANGVDDRVTLVRGWSERVDLPERADVLVAELIGSEPLEENVLETTLDARRRLLRPGARLVPHTLGIRARPLSVPDAEAGRRAYGAAAGARWRAWYGIDFGPLLDVAPASPVLEPCEGEIVATWAPVGPVVELVTIDLEAFEDATVRATADLVAEPHRQTNAVAVTFRAGLHGPIAHELDPWRWPASSWATSVWFLPEPVTVPAGGALRIGYERRSHGTPELSCRLVAPSS